MSNLLKVILGIGMLNLILSIMIIIILFVKY